MSRTIDTILRLQGESEYRAGLKGCTGEMKVLNSELSLVSSEFRTNANSLQALTAKGEVLSRMYATQEQKVDLLRGALENARETQEAEQKTVDDLRDQYEKAKKTLAEYGDAVDRNSAEYKKAQADTAALSESLAKHQTKLDASTNSIAKYTIQLNRAEVELDNLGDRQKENNRLLDEAKKSSDGYAVSIDRYGDSVQEVSDEEDNLSSSTEALATAMVASGIKDVVEDVAAAMMDASKAAQEYETSIAKVGTISDSNILSEDAMSAGILQLSTDLRRDANEVADAAYEALSAGVETADLLEFTAQSAQLAKAGFTDTATSVDVLTTILNAYKMEASQTEKVASTLVKTQDLGKVTVDDLSKVIGRVIPSAAAYSVNLDNVAAAYARMTSSGINAENSTTYLSTMLDELADSGSDVAAVLQEQTGKSFSELMAGGSSLGDVLEIIGKSVDNDNVKFSNLWSSATAGKAAISLFNDGAAAFNDTLEQMVTSSGTVAANYKKMTDTSDYASQRLAVANKNLSITVGSQLNPMLDELRNAGARVMEVAAKIVAENPALMSVITGLVTAMGLLAAGLSGLMMVKSVTTAMRALNIAMGANPAVLVAAAIAGLITALAVFSAQTETTAERVDELTEASQRLNDRTAAGAKEYAESVAAAESAYAMCDGYIERLAELEDQGVKTNAQQQEYAMLVDEIKTLMPELNIELDEQTGLIKGGVSALKDQAAAWKDAAIAEAMYASYKGDIEALVAAEYELAQNKAKLSVTTQKLSSYEKRQNEIVKEMAALESERSAVYADRNLSAAESAHRLNELTGKTQGLQVELNALIDSEKAARFEQDALNQAITEGSKTVNSNKEVVESSNAALKELEKTYPQLAGTVTESSQETADATTEAIGKIQTSYAEMLEAAQDSLGSQVGLFDDLSGKCEMTTSTMIENLISQRKAFDDYATNIELALQRGIDIGLVQQLSDGSTESMLILAELVTGTDKQIAELNEAFSGVNESKTTAADAMAAVKLAYSSGMDELASDMNAKGKTLGEQVVDGLIAGMEENEEKYTTSVRSLANAGVREYQRTNLIKSPSRRYREMAGYDVQGLIVQYQADTPKLQSAAAKMADAGYVAAIRSRRAAIPSLSAISSGNSASSELQTQSLLQQILTAIRNGQVIKLDSGALIGATAGQYNAAMGQDMVLSGRGAK